MAASEAAKEAIWLRNIINDLNIPGVHIGKVPLYIDNKAAKDIAENPLIHNRTKHIDVRYHFIREKVQDGSIQAMKVASKNNLADLFTKTLPAPIFNDLVTRLGLRNTT